jgi:2-oxoacid:acceptor oxidoreductase delta subunit (pyruvate/2-ketoisovalerate family)
MMKLTEASNMAENKSDITAKTVNVGNDVNMGGVVESPGSTRSNKTGSWRTFKPLITDRCTACGICEWYCPEGAIEIKEVNGKKRAVIDYDFCKGCMICVVECPQKVIKKEMNK